MNSFDEITLSGLRDIEGEALVCLGAGDDEIRQGWIDGVNGELVEGEHIPEPLTEVYVTETTGGRLDLVMVLKEANVGTLAVWRMGWAQDIKWLSDYVHNYADQHAVEETA